VDEGELDKWVRESQEEEGDWKRVLDILLRWTQGQLAVTVGNAEGF
jgi:hypothetical protein